MSRRAVSNADQHARTGGDAPNGVLHPGAWAAVGSRLAKQPMVSDADLERLYHETRAEHVVKEVVGNARMRPAPESPLTNRRRPAAARGSERGPVVFDTLLQPRNTANVLASRQAPHQPREQGRQPHSQQQATAEQAARELDHHIRADLTGKWDVVATWVDPSTQSDQQQGYQMFLHHDPKTGD